MSEIVGTTTVQLTTTKRIVETTINTHDPLQLRITILYQLIDTLPDGTVFRVRDMDPRSFTEDQAKMLPGFQSLYDANKTAFYALLDLPE